MYESRLQSRNESVEEMLVSARLELQQQHSTIESLREQLFHSQQRSEKLQIQLEWQIRLTEKQQEQLRTVSRGTSPQHATDSELIRLQTRLEALQEQNKVLLEKLNRPMQLVNESVQTDVLAIDTPQQQVPIHRTNASPTFTTVTEAPLNAPPSARAEQRTVLNKLHEQRMEVEQWRHIPNATPTPAITVNSQTITPHSTDSEYIPAVSLVPTIVPYRSYQSVQAQQVMQQMQLSETTIQDTMIHTPSRPPKPSATSQKTMGKIMSTPYNLHHISHQLLLPSKAINHRIVSGNGSHR